MRFLDACVIEEIDYSRNRLWYLLVLSLDADSDKHEVSIDVEYEL